MYNTVKKKIISSRLYTSPFPFLFIRNLIETKDLKKLNEILPSFNNINEKDVLYQSSSKTKKTILPSSNDYKKLNNNKNFKNLNLLFKKLKPIILKKFEKNIQRHVKRKIYSSSLKYHSSYSVMKQGYKKSPHLDRRDHLIHMIFYPYSDHKKGGEICIHKLKKKKKYFDVFPKQNSLVISKKFKVNNNCCIIILNVPWAYHSVSPYKSKKDRKYFYMVYDFPILKSGSKYKNRKAGFNQNQFWNEQVKIESSKRKKTFLTE